MAPMTNGADRPPIRGGRAALWLTLIALTWTVPSPATPRFANPVSLRIDDSATLTLPRGWGPPQLGPDTPIPGIAATISSPFGPSHLVFAQQAAPSEGFGMVTVRKSTFPPGTPAYLEALRRRDLAILLNHMESRVHDDRPAWAVRLLRGKAPALRALGGHPLIYWEGEWLTQGDRTATVRGYAFFGNGAVYLLRVIGTASRNQPDFAEEAHFADTVAATFRMR